MPQKLLPLGSAVYLQERTEELMIIERGIVYQDERTSTEVFVDYIGCIFPTGINPNSTIFFNQKNIGRIVFERLKGEDEERFLQVYDRWLKKADVPKKEIK